MLQNIQESLRDLFIAWCLHCSVVIHYKKILEGRVTTNIKI